jgi:glutamate-1-semialdehyde 2,1-aminomutase
MANYPKSEAILSTNSKYIPGGVVSTNRAVEGNRYIDFHAGFGPYILGHNDEYVNNAVRRVLDEQRSLFGSGTTALEGQLAHMICDAVPAVDSVQILNTGSEGTYQALRLARAATGRSHIIKPQGGYHGWHNDIACNLMTPLVTLGERRTADEYPFHPISAGIPEEHSSLVHPVNFNDLESVEAVCRKCPIAALICEPILQNVGIIQAQPGYLEGLRTLADKYGFILIFDEVKTGFRHALGGFSTISGVSPDLVIYGKALANGYPIAVVGGKKHLMDLFVSPDASRRVLLAGTYNAHPVPTVAAIATIERLAENNGAVYKHLEELGSEMQRGLEQIFHSANTRAVIARQGSAFCAYFMDHLPVDWHDLAANNDMALDGLMRRELLDHGVYYFQLPIKQCSLSAAHSAEDVRHTLQAVEKSLLALSCQK